MTWLEVFTWLSLRFRTASLTCLVKSAPFLEILADAESSAHPRVSRTGPAPNRFTLENVSTAFQFFEGSSSDVQGRPIVFSLPSASAHKSTKSVKNLVWGN